MFLRKGHLGMHNLIHQFLSKWFCTPSIVKYANIAWSLVNFDFVLSFRAVFKQKKVAKQQMNQSLP
jgi:hypothetical protein